MERADSKNINLLTENAKDSPGNVRFAVINGTDIAEIKKFLATLFDDIKIEKVSSNVINPVLSKLKVNIQERYRI